MINLIFNLDNAENIIKALKRRKEIDGDAYCPCKPKSTDKKDICPCFDAVINEKCCCGLFIKRD
jgi:ferredoxin-thioredoxin reductase catalytic subunit